jgi:FAD/FMN-containing dehydrogenase
METTSQALGRGRRQAVKRAVDPQGLLNSGVLIDP